MPSVLSCLDRHMNIDLEQTEEYVKGAVTNQLLGSFVIELELVAEVSHQIGNSILCQCGNSVFRGRLCLPMSKRGYGHQLSNSLPRPIQQETCLELIQYRRPSTSWGMCTRLPTLVVSLCFQEQVRE